MDNKHSSRDDSIIAVGEIGPPYGGDMSEYSQTTDECISTREISRESGDTLSCEVNANSPLSTVDENIEIDGRVRRNTSADIKSSDSATDIGVRGQYGLEEERKMCQIFSENEDEVTGTVSDSEAVGYHDREDTLMGACSSSCSSMSDCGMATTGILSVGSSGRSLGQIRESLEQKVKRLRAEKEAVDEKIRLAQDEEEIRSRERVKVRGKVAMQRKDRLRKLLNDMKSQIDDQSQRLQIAYTSLLFLQRTLFRSRSFNKTKRVKQRPALAEAPF